MTSRAVTGRPRPAIVAGAALLALSLGAASSRPAVAAPVAFHAAAAAPAAAGKAHLVPVVWGRGGGGFHGGFGVHPFMRGRFDRDDRFFHGRFGDRDDRFFRRPFFFNRPFFARGRFFFHRPFFFPRPFVFGRFDGVRFGFFP